MKYIRTKDGIYKYADYLGVFNGKRYALMDDAKGNRITMCQEQEELYQTADTIEELCDEFVLHYGDTIQTNIPIPWATYERRSDNWQKHKEKLISELKKTQRKAIVYGAIWTGKGLIYVAKINDKGALELL